MATLEEYYAWNPGGSLNHVLDSWKADREALQASLSSTNSLLVEAQEKVHELEQKPTVALLSDGDGWYWLYVNNKLVRDGHNCADLQVLCEVLKLPFEYRDWNAGEFGEVKPPEELDGNT